MTESPEEARAARLLRLYPASYRREHGPEIAAIHAEAIRDAGRLVRLREASDMVRHALRVHLCLTSADGPGRFLAAAAPYVLAVVCAPALFGVLMNSTLWADDWTAQLWADGGRTADRVEWLVNECVTLACALALLCGAAGRWAPARLLAVFGVVALPATTWVFETDYLIYHQYLDRPLAATSDILYPVLIALILLCCPADLPPVRVRDRTVIAAVAVASFLTHTIAWVKGSVGETVWTTQALWMAEILAPLAVLVVFLFAALARGGRSARFTAAGVVTAALLWLWRDHRLLDTAPYGGLLAGTLLGAAVVAAVVVRLRRRAPSSNGPARS
ncbi:hypothetical protein CP973_21540 [Streptomyces albofaciens JCM 4342]|uniref:hypothetical protein n=1 Tax=Streptomyces albofaciens TaxID=66866 RepID=UPI00123B98FD|nr:hypothetical protein [Streptomyces albofaciens]KAA6212066.1 hypothetical protein CP973_21540 [Streptomyces albofaciens JCM 4342]